MESALASTDSYLVSSQVLLPTSREEIWRRITSPAAMKEWMISITDAKMHDPGFVDGGSIGAQVELEGHGGKAGSWVCIGETTEASRSHLVREYRATKVWAASLLISGGEDRKPDYPYRRQVTHRLTMIDATRTELVTEVLLEIPGIPKYAIKTATRADRRALEASHKRLARLYSGRWLPFSFLAGTWHTPCFL